MKQETKAIDVADFVASWPQILEGLSKGQGVDVLREGEVVATVRPARRPLHGAMRGSVIIPDGFDLTKPVFDDQIYAEDGRVHE